MLGAHIALFLRPGHDSLVGQGVGVIQGLLHHLHALVGPQEEVQQLPVQTGLGHGGEQRLLVAVLLQQRGPILLDLGLGLFRVGDPLPGGHGVGHGEVHRLGQGGFVEILAHGGLPGEGLVEVRGQIAGIVEHLVQVRGDKVVKHPPGDLLALDGADHRVGVVLVPGVLYPLHGGVVQRLVVDLLLLGLRRFRGYLRLGLLRSVCFGRAGASGQHPQRQRHT